MTADLSMEWDFHDILITAKEIHVLFIVNVLMYEGIVKTELMIELPEMKPYLLFLITYFFSLQI